MTENLLVFQSDFGKSDGSVSAMYGVALSISKDLKLFDLTHEIPKFSIWEASYRLYQTIHFWPKGTVFISIVDPGVGTNRRALVVKTRTGHYIVTPDNGTLTHLHFHVGICEARLIDGDVHRLSFSGESHTFHGRDIFAYVAGKLASRKITFEEVGESVDTSSIVTFPTPEADAEKGSLIGFIEIIDRPFGNIWTNIKREQFFQIAKKYGQSFELTILHNDEKKYQNIVTYHRSFGDLNIGEPLVYINSLDFLGIAMNQESFTERYQIGFGTDWKVKIQSIEKRT